jgi:hypothetical protein
MKLLKKLSTNSSSRISFSKFCLVAKKNEIIYFRAFVLRSKVANLESTIFKSLLPKG